MITFHSRKLNIKIKSDYLQKIEICTVRKEKKKQWVSIEKKKNWISETRLAKINFSAFQKVH